MCGAHEPGYRAVSSIRKAVRWIVAGGRTLDDRRCRSYNPEQHASVNARGVPGLNGNERDCVQLK